MTTPFSSVVYGVMMVSAKTSGMRKAIQQIKVFISENIINFRFSNFKLKIFKVDVSEKTSGRRKAIQQIKVFVG